MPNKKPKVLMIEEDRFLRKIYRDKLSRLSFDFLEATNGEEGLNKVIYEKPDVVILDLMLPKKNGFDVLIDIRSNKNTQNIPVIILSNLGQESDIKRALDLGATSYLVKTDISLSGVVDKVKEQVAKNR
ncbi:MAG: hypothetical protein A2Z78_00245 [Candidatus Nealsonbacteria bacterium RBG_13_36_15]|uniref:Response regulatory domain-containing protein n=1 Tax=Candidatus Nealsonbacteria bacterium RBG_13_36_15 TaxID=1801660 RepID=A0A1G2DXT8_9BACT|nr:MAG: hypothetical protein A2Z78_00245 [Candidatus Nealsonbacteria bacterium RBG_13_36_15]